MKYFYFLFINCESQYFFFVIAHVSPFFETLYHREEIITSNKKTLLSDG